MRGKMAKQRQWRSQARPATHEQNGLKVETPTEDAVTPILPPLAKLASGERLSLKDWRVLLVGLVALLSGGAGSKLLDINEAPKRLDAVEARLGSVEAKLGELRGQGALVLQEIESLRQALAALKLIDKE